MKNMKSVLAMILAACLILSLAVPVFATGETTTATAQTTAAAEDTTGAAEDTIGAVEGATVADEDISVPLDEEHDHDHDHDDTQTTGAENGPRKVIRVIVIVLEVIASVALIGIVLVQSGKESGLSGAISGNSDSYMNKGNRATLDKKLARATKWVALAWVVLTLILSMI